MSKRLWRAPRGKRPPAVTPDSEDAAGMTQPEHAETPPQEAGHVSAPGDPDMEKASLVVRQIDRWIASMERLRLADYVRYVDDRKRMFWTSFWAALRAGWGWRLDLPSLARY